MMEVLLDQDIHINALVILLINRNKFKDILECLMVVHRRCREKVGNYCGYEGNIFELYAQWKDNVC